MKVSDDMTITILDMMGREVSGGFEVPPEATRDDVNDEEKMLRFARNMLNEYFDCKEAIEKHYQEMLDKCTCFWKDKPESERIMNMCHSSTCPCLED